MTKPIRIVQRINAHCQLNKHNECPAVSKMIFITTIAVFVCSCDRHKKVSK